MIEPVSAALPRLGLSQSRAVRKLAAEGPPDEQVGLEPFAPPEVMPVDDPAAARPMVGGWEAT